MTMVSSIKKMLKEVVAVEVFIPKLLRDNVRSTVIIM